MEIDNKIPSIEDKYLLKAQILVRQIIVDKLGRFHLKDIEGLEQRVFLMLRQTKLPPTKLDLNEEEWLRLASTVAQNEVNDFLASKDSRTLPLSDINEESDESSLNQGTISGNTIYEDSPIKARSLLALVWKIAKSLNMLEKYSFFLHQPDFIIDFIAGGCCTTKQLADYFEITGEDLGVLIESYPLSDHKIADLLEKKFAKKFSIQIIRKGRAKAKAKIAKTLAG